MDEGRHEPFASNWPFEEKDMDIEKQKLIYKLYMKHKSTNYIQEKLQEAAEDPNSTIQTGSDHRTINQLIEDEGWDVKRNKKDKRIFDKLLKKIEDDEIKSIDIANEFFAKFIKNLRDGKIKADSPKMLIELLKIREAMKGNPLEGTIRLSDKISDALDKAKKEQEEKEKVEKE